MAEPVRFRITDGVAIVTLDHPPVNTLTAAVIAGLWDVFSGIGDLPEVVAVVLMAEGRMFSAGADILALGKPIAAPTLAALCDLIEACPHPVVVAIQGAALGGGAELALAGHYRLAAADAGIGLPEVTLGLVPGAGGTQRLPRLVGAEVALAMLLGGRPVAAAEAQKPGVIDGIVGGDMLTAAVGYARTLIAEAAGPRPTRARRDKLTDGAAYLEAVASRRAALSASRLQAPKRIVDCVEAALLLPFAAGIAYEAAALRDCLAHPQSLALRHLFVAERQVPPGLMTRSAKGFAPTTDGQAVVDRLQAAARRAGAALVANGATQARVDDAMRVLGVREGPFGGGDPAATGADLVALQRRLIAALMAEGGRMIADGTLRRARDVDALAVHGLGLHRWRGGPMAAAQGFGLLDLGADMQSWQRDDPVWTPPPILREASKYARGFDAPELR